MPNAQVLLRAIRLTMRHETRHNTILERRITKRLKRARLLQLPLDSSARRSERSGCRLEVTIPPELGPNARHYQECDRKRNNV